MFSGFGITQLGQDERCRVEGGGEVTEGSEGKEGSSIENEMVDDRTL